MVKATNRLARLAKEAHKRQWGPGEFGEDSLFVVGTRILKLKDLRFWMWPNARWVPTVEEAVGLFGRDGLVLQRSKLDGMYMVSLWKGALVIAEGAGLSEEEALFSVTGS